MYRPEELLNIVEKPRINDISLEVLQQFYTMFLRPFVYCYEITDGDIKSRVELAFDKDKFCHLLGVETVAKNVVVHLGIDKAGNERCYYPRSFFVEKLKDDNIDIYTVNQQSIRAEKIDRMILLGE